MADYDIKSGSRTACNVFNYLRLNKFRAKEMRLERNSDSGMAGAVIYVEGKNPEDPFRIVELKGLESLMLSDPEMNWKGECVMEGTDSCSGTKITIIYGEEPHIPRRKLTSRDVQHLIRNPSLDQISKIGGAN